MSIRMEDAGATIMKNILTCIVVSGVSVKPIREYQHTSSIAYLFSMIAAKSKVCRRHVR
jgi:hypothetical protein